MCSRSSTARCCRIANARTGLGACDALEKALITNTVTGVRDPGAVQSRGIHAEAATSTTRRRRFPGCRRRFCSSSTATCRRSRWSCSSTPTRSTRSAAAIVNAAQSDVRMLTRQVTDLMNIEPSTHAPPVLLFTWGSLAFTCVLATRVASVRDVPAGRHAGARAADREFQRIPQRRSRSKEIKRETSDYSKRHVVSQGETLSVDRRRASTAIRGCGA